MGIRKIYTNGVLELEMSWSKQGIHLEINHCIPGELPSTEFVLEPSDLDEFLEDFEIYSSAVGEYNVISKSSADS